MNLVVQIGRIGQDTELRYTTSGKAVANASLAVDIGYGENKKTLWVKVVLWEKLAENLAQYLTKGKQIAVTGELAAPEAWIGKQAGDAQARIVVTARHIEFCGSKPQGDSEQRNSGSGPDERPGPEISDEDIPF